MNEYKDVLKMNSGQSYCLPITGSASIKALDLVKLIEFAASVV